MNSAANNLIFVHGAGSGSDFWNFQRVAFPNAHYVNLPGHGWRHAGSMVHTWAGGGRKSIEEYGDWLADYIEAQKLDNVVLIGHSMGGAVALELALRKPAWLIGLVLTGSGARFEVSDQLIDLLRSDYRAAVEQIVKESFGAGNETPTYKQKAMRYGTTRQMQRTPQEVVLGDYEASAQFDVSNRLGEIAFPTLVLVGEQDKVTPPTLSKELHAGISGSHLAIVEGAGHMLPMEKAEEFNNLLQEFAGRLTRAK